MPEMNNNIAVILNAWTNTTSYLRMSSLLYMLGVFVTLSMGPFYSGMVYGLWGYCFFNMCLYFLVSLTISIILISDNIIIKIIKTVFFLFVVVLKAILLGGQVFFGLSSENDVLAAIAQTNKDEALEFIQCFASAEIVVICLLIFTISVVFLLLTVWSTKKFKVPNSVFLILFLCTFTSITATAYNPDFLYTFIYSLSYNSNNNSIDLRDYQSLPKVKEVCTNHPATICIIIGESFSKYHSSVYGYKRNTNPNLERLIRNGSVVAFDSVQSPACSTTPCFQYILNTHHLGEAEDWYKSISIPQVYRALGYHTIWLSNQQEYGFTDNLPSSFSKLCDETYFLHKNGKTYDMVLADYLNNLELDNTQNLIFLHLLGQHNNYSKRYPKEYDVFRVSEYLECPEHQRANLASYDNATLYNDSVISSLFSIMREKDAICFYFPDHGEDLYYSNKNYCMHGKPNDPESFFYGRQIPFFVYMSNEFRNTHPSLVSLIKDSSAYPFCTDSFIYKLMEYTGYSFM